MHAGKNADEDRLIDLMVGYQNGNMADFEGLYAALEQPLMRYLWSFVRNTAAAEDLLQKTFLQVHRARHTYQPRRPVRPWIYAISRHVALMHLRSGRRRREQLAHDELPELPVSPEVEKLADADTVRKLLLELPASAREVLIMHHLLGLSFKEIGLALGIATGTAKVRSHRAIKALREMIASRQDFGS